MQYHKGFYSQLPDAYDVTINLPTYVKNVLVNGRLIAVTESSVAVTLSNASLVSARMRTAKTYPTEGLLAAWRFDENSGNSVSDALGVRNGTFTGAKWTNGISGSALEFDGVDGNMVVPNNSNFNPTGDKISVSFWFKLSEVGASGSFDEVKLFSAALDQTQIQSHFNNQVVALDQDGDGVPNESDAYPNDPAIAFNNYYPAQGYGSLAFEDLWPGKGDYDFNDLVADYRFKIVTNSNNKVTEVISTTVVRAIGAGYRIWCKCGTWNTLCST